MDPKHSIIKGTALYRQNVLKYLFYEYHYQTNFAVENRTDLSHVMRLWYFSSSVNSFFKRVCASIQWG